MSKYTIESSTLTGIADAIRSKGGTTAALKPSDMPDAIAAIQAGGGSAGGVSGFAAYVNGDTNIIYDENVTKIRDYLFYNITSKNVPARGYDFPNATEIGTHAFYNSEYVTSVNFPKAQIIKDWACGYMQSITELILPEIVTIESYAFYCNDANIGKLKKIDLGNKIEMIEGNAFTYHQNLEAVIIRSNSVCTLANSNAFSNTNANSQRYFYVPAALVESYKTATNWSTYKSYFRAIEDYPDICGEVE